MRLAGCDLRRSAGRGRAAATCRVEPARRSFADWLLERLSVRHRLEYAAVRRADRAGRVMPGARWCGGAARCLGLAFYVFDRAHRRVAERNVAAAFPVAVRAPSAAHRARAFAHFGRLLFELLKFSTLSRRGRCSRASSSRARSACARAYAQGKGVLFVTGHFGFWELQAMVHALRLRADGVLARALDNPR